jgi:hypothetical protein
MSDSSFDFQSFVREADITESESIIRRRSKRRSKDSNEKRKKVKSILNKVAAVAEKAFEIYVLLKSRKDPVGLVLGAVSAYDVVSNLFEREKPEPVGWLREIGAVKAFPMLCSFIYHTLRQIDVPSRKCWGNDADTDSNEAEKIDEFDLGEDVKVWFVIVDAGHDAAHDPSEGPYVLDADAFVARFSAIVQEHLGNIVSINTFTKGWEEYYYLGSVDIPTELYVSPIDEEELHRRVLELQALENNRTMLFCGPPGAGKTTLAARMVEKMTGRLLVATSHVLDSGRGRNLMEGLIDIIDPSVVLLDDLDKMWRPNDMLDSMEKLNRQKGTRKRLLIGTVNTLGDIPEPMRRPGRFDEIVEFTRPSVDQRDAILAMYLREFSVMLSDEERFELAQASRGMTGAYLKEVSKRAKVLPFAAMLDEVLQMKRICGIEDEDDEESSPPKECSEDGNADPAATLLDLLQKAAVSGLVKERSRGWYTGRMRRRRRVEQESFLTKKSTSR